MLLAFHAYFRHLLLILLHDTVWALTPLLTKREHQASPKLTLLALSINASTKYSPSLGFRFETLYLSFMIVHLSV
jgi:hypothetical protein